MTDVAIASLPSAIATYLRAHRAKDVASAITAFAENATVTDVTDTFAGLDAIRGWLARSSAEFKYTIEPVSANRADACHYAVVQHLEGDFPGGVVDLTYLFTLRDGSIGELVIAA